jgi:hypothetical protein
MKRFRRLLVWTANLLLPAFHDYGELLGPLPNISRLKACGRGGQRVVHSIGVEEGARDIRIDGKLHGAEYLLWAVLL